MSATYKPLGPQQLNFGLDAPIDIVRANRRWALDALITRGEFSPSCKRCLHNFDTSSLRWVGPQHKSYHDAHCSCGRCF